MDKAPEGEEPGSLRFLRLLVTTLTVVMIVGFIVLIGFLVTRFPDTSSVSLPDQILLPDGAQATAFTKGEDWYAIVTAANQILIYNADGSLRKTIDIAQ